MYLDEDVRALYLDKLRPRLSPDRYRHTLSVEKESIRLAERFSAEVAKAQTAALLHDYAKTANRKCAQHPKCILDIDTFNPALQHGEQGAHLIKTDLGVDDSDILNAVRFHTTGRAHMSKLEKIIYIADLIEENRDFSGVDALRKLAEQDLDAAVIAGLAHVIGYVLKRRFLLAEDSVRAYNSLLAATKIRRDS